MPGLAPDRIGHGSLIGFDTAHLETPDGPWGAIVTYTSLTPALIDAVRIAAFQSEDAALAWLEDPEGVRALHYWSGEIHPGEAWLDVTRPLLLVLAESTGLYIAFRSPEPAGIEQAALRIDETPPSEPGNGPALDGDNAMRAVRSCTDGDVTISLTAPTSHCRGTSSILAVTMIVVNCSSHRGRAISWEIKEDDVFNNDEILQAEGFPHSQTIPTNCTGSWQYSPPGGYAIDLGEYESSATAELFASVDLEIPGFNDACDTSPNINVSLGNAPSSPGNVQATDGTYCDKVRVTWNAVSGADSYRVTRGNTGGTLLCSGSSSTTCDDTNVPAAAPYTYTVVAVNSCGSSAAASDQGFRLGPPADPTSVSATDNDCEEVRVAWSSVSGAEWYEVWWENQRIASNVSSSTTSYIDREAPAGSDHPYSVKSCRALCGCSNGRSDSGRLVGCDDGNFCNGTETCGGNGSCTQGSTPCSISQCCDEDANECEQCPVNCGDGVVGAGEECDDGNTSNTDSCTNACRNARCGDGFVQAGSEQCDDGNMGNEDGCSASCATETSQACGNGIREGTEQCDDGNTSNEDGCSASCVTETSQVCGNGIREGAEQCDDGNTANGDGCSAGCTIEPHPPTCGNGIVDAAEECDDENTSSSDACTTACRNARCGDGIVRAGVEQCDDGNATSGDGCSACVHEPRCGNRTVDAGEDCDDGNTSNSDACTTSCRFARCGDGFVRAGLEQCDDGNTASGDMCSPTCTIGIVEPVCGNGVRSPGEECDDGNTTNGDGCSAQCLLDPDEDYDGVPDSNDQCAETPPGTSVNSVGCAACQKLDADNDGVDDCVDTCPATPSGAAVDGDGCGRFTIILNYEPMNIEEIISATEGEVKLVDAPSIPNWRFDRWSGADVPAGRGRDNPLFLEMKGNTRLVGVYEPEATTPVRGSGITLCGTGTGCTPGSPGMGMIFVGLFALRLANPGSQRGRRHPTDDGRYTGAPGGVPSDVGGDRLMQPLDCHRGFERLWRR